MNTIHFNIFYDIRHDVFREATTPQQLRQCIYCFPLCGTHPSGVTLRDMNSPVVREHVDSPYTIQSAKQSI